MCYDRLQVELIKMAWLQCFLVKAFPYALPKEFTREPADTKEQILLPEEGGLVLVLRWEQPLGSKFQMQWMFNVTKRNWYREWFETRSNSLSCSLIVRVWVVHRKTVVASSDLCFNNLGGSHHYSQVSFCFVWTVLLNFTVMVFGVRIS